MFSEVVEDIASPLRATRCRIHRIKCDAAIVVRGEPIIWKNRIWLLRRSGVIKNVDCHANMAELCHCLVELLLRGF